MPADDHIAINQRHHAVPLHSQVNDAKQQPPLSGNGELPITRNQARELHQLLAALEQLEQTFATAGDFKPYVAQPQPGLRQRPPS